MNQRQIYSVLIVSFLVALMLPMFGCGGDSAAPEANISGTSAITTDSPTVVPSIGDDAASPAQSTLNSPNNRHPKVRISTSLGDITVKLDAEKAPHTVTNFLEYVDRRFYEGTIFHYIDPGFIAMAGGYTEDLQAKETRAEIMNEAHNGLKNARGTISMARDPAIIHGASSQFFFNLADNASLDHVDRESAADYGYCVFGEIVEGLDVIELIASIQVRDTDDFVSIPVESIVIKSVQRVE